jgi:hypothetical protein
MKEVGEEKLPKIQVVTVVFVFYTFLPWVPTRESICDSIHVPARVLQDGGYVGKIPGSTQLARTGLRFCSILMIK